ncbi:MAG: formate dehydrogenase subunit alpha [Gemmatimonadetes bacterium]|nr:formate dehydrogenase subunit alpha [Gemmatimonadota bacterium]
MITLSIDGRAVTVPNGATILDAARGLAIDVPTLCWYPRLPVVGSCRLCLVSVAGAPKLMAACAAQAEEGMAVETETPAAVANRRSVLGLLLERYPTDRLAPDGQDVAVGAAGFDGGGPNEFERLLRRYAVPLRPERHHELALRTGDERPGDPMIRHDMSTCILCTRCVRACADLQVVGVLDVAQRGERAEIVVGGDGDPDHAACTWCGECVRVCPTGAIHEVLPPRRFPKERVAAPERAVRSVCPYCGVGCQVDLHVRENAVVRVTSPWIEEDTPNSGSTCVKGRFGYDFPQHRDRLRAPLIRRGWVKRRDRWRYEGPAAERRRGPWLSIDDEGERPKPRPPERAVGKPLASLSHIPRGPDDVRDRVATPASWYEPFREATWDEAMELVSQELSRIRRERGPDALAVFCSAKCTNEENYVLQRMFRAGFNTNNVDHCTRLCHSSSVAAMQRALNTSAASGSMREVEEVSDVIFVAGANVTEAHPVFGAAVKRAQRRGAKLIVADTRRIELAQRADIHLHLLPGTDVALFNAMLWHIITRDLHDRAFIAGRTHGFDAVRAAVEPYTLQRAQTITGVPAADIAQAAELFARGPRSSTLWAMGLTQHAAGTDIVASLLNLILATGMIGRWGAAMIPIRGQNNVQGASDVGAIPMFYTDYQSVADPAVRRRFATAWRVPEESLSLTPGLRVTEVVAEGSPVRGMYIFGENPIISDPDVAHAEHWFQALEFLAVQDLFLTETARLADVVLPGASYAEKDGTFVNTERRIQRVRKACEPPGEARGDLEILIELSNRAGLPAPFADPREVMEEIAAVTPSWAGVTYERLDMAGLQYPVPDRESGGAAFLFADRFPTGDGRGTMVPVEYLPPSELPNDQYPFMMNTGRQLYHWHTGTMTRRAKGLDAREPVPTVELNPADAAELGVFDGDPVRLVSRRNAILIAARISDRVQRRQLFLPFHFREAAANLLTNPALDPYAKIPEFKCCAVRVEGAA